MFEFHADKEVYFRMQYENARDYVIPFIEEKFPLKPEFNVLEIGCAEGGVLKAFLDRGLKGAGVELSAPRAEMARKFLASEIQSGRAAILDRDIYDASFQASFKNHFDLIVLKDVIEHIHDQEKLLMQMKNYLKPGGKIFFGFPPWQMPFGGHQQVCRNKLLSTFPYYHLLPGFLYKGILKSFGEIDLTIKDLMEVKETGISIERFEKILKRQRYITERKVFYFINPIYKYKFGWKAREQSKLIASIPFVRNFFTTCVYYLVSI